MFTIPVILDLDGQAGAALRRRRCLSVHESRKHRRRRSVQASSQTTTFVLMEEIATRTLSWQFQCDIELIIELFL